MLALAFFAYVFSGYGGVLCAQEEYDIEIAADSLRYDEANHFVVAAGSVTVTWKDKQLTAGQVRFWMDSRCLRAENDVLLVDGDGRMGGKAIEYDYGTERGRISSLSGYSEPWYFSAEEAEKRGEKWYAAERIGITTCNLRKPHYIIRARRATIRLEKRITVYGAVFYLWGMPVMYLPVYAHGMGPHRDSLEIKPGYDVEDGLLLKVIYGYPLSRNTYGKLYLDYFGRRGFGKGAEYNYDIPGRMKGTLYGYHVKEETTGNERGTLRGAHWQTLSPLWIGQAEAEFLSDTSFNNLYFQENWQHINQRIRSYVSFTRQGLASNFRALVERNDVYDPATGSFELQSVLFPRFTFTRYPFRTRYHFFTSLSATVQNEYNRLNDYYLLSGNVDSSITDDYRLSRNLTFTPRLGVSESWQNRTSPADTASLFVTRYFSDVNLRYRPARWVDLDFTHHYRLRSLPNSLLPDVEGVDYGEETNLFTFRNSMYMGSRLTLRNTVGYDYRWLRAELIDDWRSKLTPLTTELTWLPRFSSSLYLREEQNLYPFSLRAIQADMRVGDYERRYLNLGVFYQSFRPDQVDFITGVGFWPTRNVRLDVNVGGTSLNNFGDLRMNTQEVKLYRNLHCWEFRVTYRRRLNVEEVYFQLDLTSAAKNRENIYPREHEREFYPWR